MVVEILLDFSGEFATINYDISLLKLEHYGVRGKTRDWSKILD